MKKQFQKNRRPTLTLCSRLFVLILCTLIFYLRDASANSTAQPRTSLQKINSALQAGKISDTEALHLKFKLLFSPSSLPRQYKFSQTELKTLNITSKETGQYLTVGEKCGTPILKEILQKYQTLPDDFRREIDQILRNRESYNVELTYPSPAGHFLIHYSVDALDAPNTVNATDTDDHGQGTGTFNAQNAPDIIESYAKYFDHSWTQLIGSDAFHFNRPPTDWIIGGGNDLLDIYVADIGARGITTPGLLGDVWFHVNNALSDYDRKGTCPHEFFHGIQASYDFWEATWLTEGTARFIEDVVYDDLNRYIFDNINDLLITPDTKLTEASYSAVLFWKYFAEHFGTDGSGNHAYSDPNPNKIGYDPNGVDIIKELWIACKSANGIDAVNTVLNSHSSYFELAFSYWLKTNYAKDLGNPFIGGFLDYLEDENGYGHVRDFLPASNIITVPSNGVLDPSSPQLHNEKVNAWAADYVLVKLNNNVGSITVNFNGADDIPILAPDRFCSIQILFLKDNDNDGNVDDMPNSIADYAISGSNIFNRTVNNDGYDEMVIIVAGGNSGASDIFGNYDLKVSTNSGVDIALVIDRSGSMECGWHAPGVCYLRDAKNAANYFVGLMQTGDNIAVISFTDWADVNFPLTKIESEATKTAAQNAINAIETYDMTSIGAGIQSAQGELNKGNTQKYQGMVLLSDGMENWAPMVASVLPTIPEKTDIYTVALGSYSDQLLLNSIAAQTGGFYSFAPDQTGLQAIYNAIRAKISNQQTLAKLSGNISQGQTQSEAVQVDGSVSTAMFSVAWSGSDIDLTLVDPNGRIINPDTAAIDPNITFTSGTTYEFYNVNSPLRGQWMMNITGVDIPSGSEAYSAAVTASATLEMDMSFDKISYGVGDSILVLANVHEISTPITGATVVADVQVPTLAAAEALRNAPALHDREKSLRSSEKNTKDTQINIIGKEKINADVVYYTTATINLYDDGAHGDGAANDGIYANYFKGTNTQGSYTFGVKASGTSPTSGAFTREDTRSTIVTLKQTITVTTPPNGKIWRVGNAETVNWSSTNITGNVNIKLSIDGGSSYPINLALDTPNDGVEQITVPNDTSSQCRIKVEWTSNPSIVFGLNPGFFAIIPKAGSPTLSLPVVQGFNALSWNIQPEDGFITSVFSKLLVADKVQVILEYINDGVTAPHFSFHIPELNQYNPLQKTDVHKGYFVKLKKGVVPDTVVINGVRVPPDVPIPVREGYNFVSYLPQQSDLIRHALQTLDWSNVWTVLNYINTGTGLPGSEYFETYPKAGSAFQTMCEGKGYFVYLNGGTDTIVYPNVVRFTNASDLAANLPIGIENASKPKLALSDAGRGFPAAVFAYGIDVKYHGKLVPAGSVLKATDRNGVVCGDAKFIADGIFGMAICGDDPATGDVDEGAEVGEWVNLWLNGEFVPAKIRWTEFGDTPRLEDMSVTGIDEVNLLPREYLMEQNYPNPFNPKTMIKFQLPSESFVSLKIFNMLGQEVRTLINGIETAGYKSREWDGRDNAGRDVGSGLYIYQLISGSYSKTLKMLLMK